MTVHRVLLFARHLNFLLQKTILGGIKLPAISFIHGFYSAESMAERKFIRQLLRNSRETLEQVKKNVEAGAIFSGFSERL